MRHLDQELISYVVGADGEELLDAPVVVEMDAIALDDVVADEEMLYEHCDLGVTLIEIVS